MSNQLLRAEQVAERLGLGRTKVYELIGRGEIPVIRFGAAVRVPEQALAEMIAARTTRPVEAS
jgi:excisionase family DNA binding protein